MRRNRVKFTHLILSFLVVLAFAAGASADDVTYTLGDDAVFKIYRGPSELAPGYTERGIQIIPPSDSSLDMGVAQVYGHVRVTGDAGHAAMGIGPVLAFDSDFTIPAYNRHFRLALGDTHNLPGTNQDDVIMHSWDADYQNNIVYMLLKSNGDIGIGTTNPTYKLHVNGSVAGTSWTTLSSRDFKENIKKVDSSEYEGMLASLMDVNLSTYNYKKEYDNDSSTRLGFIAEEMPKEVLSRDGKGVDVYELLTFTIGAMKAQQEQIKELEAQLKELKAATGK